MKSCDCADNGKNNCNCKEIAESELRRKLDLLLRTGSILMESAADTSRIMRTMKRAAAFLGLDERYMHLYINWNVLMVNYSTRSIPSPNSSVAKSTASTLHPSRW